MCCSIPSSSILKMYLRQVQWTITLLPSPAYIFVWMYVCIYTHKCDYRTCLQKFMFRSFVRSSKLLQHDATALEYVWIRNALTAQVFSECVPHVRVEETYIHYTATYKIYFKTMHFVRAAWHQYIVKTKPSCSIDSWIYSGIYLWWIYSQGILSTNRKFDVKIWWF